MLCAIFNIHNKIDIMTNMIKAILLASSLIVTLNATVQAKEQLLDRVAAIVNGGVVLESEVEDLLANIKRQAKKITRLYPQIKLYAFK